MIRKLRPSDWFLIINVVLFLLMSREVYYGQMAGITLSGTNTEFLIHAGSILTAIFAIWWYLRRIAFPVWLLVMVQGGIMVHFAGGYVHVDGARLYDTALFASDASWSGIHYDKFVHIYNAFAGSALITHLFRHTRSHSPMARALVVLSVLGAGAIVEIVEYLVSVTVQANGVGAYDNNMLDMVANLAGALLFEAVRLIVKAMRRPGAGAGAEWADRP